MPKLADLRAEHQADIHSLATELLSELITFESVSTNPLPASDPVQHITSTLNFRYQQLSVEHITPRSPLITALHQHPPLAHLLYSILVDPAHLDTSQHPILSATPVQHTRPAYHFYVRLLTGTVTEHQQWSRALIDAKPYELLTELGFLADLHYKSPDEVITRTYWGYSSYLTGLERAAADMDREYRVEKRWATLVKATPGLRARVKFYEIPLWAPLFAVIGSGSAYEARQCIAVQQLERAFITATSRFSLNSDIGGLTVQFQPNSAQLRLHEQISTALSTSTSAFPTLQPSVLADQQDILDDTLAQHFESAQLDFGLADRRMPMSEIGLSEVTKVGSVGKLLSTGRLPFARVLKDITEEQHDVQNTGVGWFSPRAGQTAVSHRSILALVWDEPASLAAHSLSTPLNTLREAGCQPMVDLWSLTLHHTTTRITLALLHLVRYLSLLPTPLVIAESAKLARLLPLDLTDLVHPQAHPLAVAQFFDEIAIGAASYVVNDSFKGRLPTWNDMPVRDFIKNVGQLVVIRIRPGVFRLVLQQYHYGHLHWDPHLRRPITHLLFLVEEKARVVSAVVAQLGAVGSSAQELKAVVAAADAICQQVGLDHRIEEAKKEVERWGNPIRGLRRLVAVDRQLDERVAQLVQEDVLLTQDEAREMAGHEERVRNQQRWFLGIKAWRDASLESVGAPHSAERIAVRADVLAMHDNLQERALPSPVGAPRGTTIGSVDWCDWFDSIAPGMNLRVSAARTLKYLT